MSQFYYVPEKKLAVFWSPKCACSSIVIWLKKYIELNCEESNIKLNNLKNDPRFWLNQKGYNYPKWQNIIPLANNHITHFVFLTRNPYSRIVSSFLNKFIVYKGKTLKNIDQLEPFARNFIVKYSNSNLENKPSIDKEGNFSISLFEFIDIIDKTKELLNLNDHFRPQITSKTEFNTITQLLDSKHISEKIIIKTENFSKDITKLNQSINFNFVPPKVNSTMKKGWELINDQEVINLKNTELINKKLMPTKNALLSFIRNNENCKLNCFRFDKKIFNRN
tara:strand:- start:588 stop:1424 length:837 start_codon:yes stop_codon:yes gene_type:complete